VTLLAQQTSAPTRAPAPVGDVRHLGRVPAFDGLRAVLVAAVLAYHLDGGRLKSAVGEVAVIVFFVLSGFLITALLAEEHERSGRIAIGAFYARRARRLFPALGALLVAWLIVALLAGHEPWMTSVPGGGAGTGISPRTALEVVGVAAGYVTNWFDALPGLHLWVGYSPLGHLWTLAVEEQFYLLLAPVMVVILRMRRAQWLMSGATALAFADPVMLWHDGTHRLYFGTDARAGAMLLGSAVALWWVRGHFSWLARRGMAPLTIGVSGAGLLVAGFGFTGDVHEWSWIGGLVLAAAAGGLVVTTLATGRDDAVSKMLSRPTLMWIGQRSYGIYLWGYVFNTWFRSLGIATAPVVIVTTVGTAALSYRFIERPFLRRGAMDLTAVRSN
jgi:peptidoglycan/LPS O-acetylase OafA/YrhL